MAIVGCATYVLLKDAPNDGSKIQINQIGFRHEANATIINLVENSTPSRPVHLVGTDLYFNSISDAAKKTGHSVSQISKQVNGHVTNVKGDVFELLQAA